MATIGPTAGSVTLGRVVLAGLDDVVAAGRVVSGRVVVGRVVVPAGWDVAAPACLVVLVGEGREEAIGGAVSPLDEHAPTVAMSAHVAANGLRRNPRLR